MRRSVFVSTRGASAAADSRFRKPCIANPLAASNRLTGWCSPAVALKGTPAWFAARMKSATASMLGNASLVRPPQRSFAPRPARATAAIVCASDWGECAALGISTNAVSPAARLPASRRLNPSIRARERLALRPNSAAESRAQRLTRPRVRGHRVELLEATVQHDGERDAVRPRPQGRRGNDEPAEQPGVRTRSRRRVFGLCGRNRELCRREKACVVDQRVKRRAHGGPQHRRRGHRRLL